MNMMLEQYPKTTTIFRLGDIGTKFYIILKGSVGVYIP
jgi:CRP-like cAMP-binding protein